MHAGNSFVARWNLLHPVWPWILLAQRRFHLHRLPIWLPQQCRQLSLRRMPGRRAAEHRWQLVRSMPCWKILHRRGPVHSLRPGVYFSDRRLGLLHSLPRRFSFLGQRNRLHHLRPRLLLKLRLNSVHRLPCWPVFAVKRLRLPDLRCRHFPSHPLRAAVRPLSDRLLLCCVSNLLPRLPVGLLEQRHRLHTVPCRHGSELYRAAL
jgi:hypothetical protein